MATTATAEPKWPGGVGGGKFFQALQWLIKPIIIKHISNLLPLKFKRKKDQKVKMHFSMYLYFEIKDGLAMKLLDIF